MRLTDGSFDLVSAFVWRFVGTRPCCGGLSRRLPHHGPARRPRTPEAWLRLPGETVRDVIGILGDDSVARCSLDLQPGQIAALETLRGSCDFSFEFKATVRGFDKTGEQYVLDDWRHRVLSLSAAAHAQAG